jgi:hypothetical protein
MNFLPMCNYPYISKTISHVHLNTFTYIHINISVYRQRIYELLYLTKRKINVDPYSKHKLEIECASYLILEHLR